MKFKGFLLHVPFFWVEAMAFFPFVFLKRKSPSPKLLNHECIHLRQQLEMGLILFYIWYLAEYFVGLIQYKKHYLAYLSISFEREAYMNEKNFEYLNQRKFWAFLGYLGKGRS